MSVTNCKHRMCTVVRIFDNIKGQEAFVSIVNLLLPVWWISFLPSKILFTISMTELYKPSAHENNIWDEKFTCRSEQFVFEGRREYGCHGSLGIHVSVNKVSISSNIYI